MLGAVAGESILFSLFFIWRCCPLRRWPAATYEVGDWVQFKVEEVDVYLRVAVHGSGSMQHHV